MVIFMKQVILKTFLSLVVFSVSVHAVENSVIPLVEHFEAAENLPVNKLTTNQLKEISNALSQKDEKIRLVTYNMLFNLYDHNLAHDNRWPSRSPRIMELVHHMRPDIISTQELYPDQVRDLEKLIGDEFTFFAGQMDDDGESAGIFYRKDRFQVMMSEVIEPVSVLQLRDLKTNRIVSIFNTHMSFGDAEKRERQARKIVKIVEPFAKKTAVIFTGDLNTFAMRMGLRDLPFYDGDYIHRILSKGCLKNTHETSLLGHFGPISTFTNHHPSKAPFMGLGTPGVILDYIYASDKVTVIAHAVESGTVNGHFPSDHMPVFIDFLINK
jgi:endonuclease/exonuclease/phosphatase family metal-dependent hydrolase